MILQSAGERIPKRPRESREETIGTTRRSEEAIDRRRIARNGDLRGRDGTSSRSRGSSGGGGGGGGNSGARISSGAASVSAPAAPPTPMSTPTTPMVANSLSTHSSLPPSISHPLSPLSRTLSFTSTDSNRDEESGEPLTKRFAAVRLVSRFSQPLNSTTESPRTTISTSPSPPRPQPPDMDANDRLD